MTKIEENFSVDPSAKFTDRPVEYIRPKAAAEYLGISRSSLAKLRMRANRANGPQFLKQGGSVIYRRGDLDRWMSQLIVCSVTEPRPTTKKTTMANAGKQSCVALRGSSERNSHNAKLVQKGAEK